MKVQFNYLGKTGGKAVTRKYVDIEHITYIREENRGKARTHKKVDEKKRYLEIGNDGRVIASFDEKGRPFEWGVEKTKHNMREMQKQIYVGDFELEDEEQEKYLYEYGDFTDEIAKEIKAMERAKIALKEKKIRENAEKEAIRQRMMPNRETVLKEVQTQIIKEVEVPVYKHVLKERTPEHVEKNKAALEKARNARSKKLAEQKAAKEASKKKQEVNAE